MKNIIIPESNIDVYIDRSLSVKNKKILVLSLVRNIVRQKSLTYIYTFIKNLQEQFSQSKFFFFSNNNQDSTVSQLALFKRTYPNNIDYYIHTNEKFLLKDRIEYLSKYRDINFTKAINCFGTDFDYLIVFDSDLSDNIPINSIEESLQIYNIEWSAITGNHCYSLSEYYYDELAIRLENEDIDIRKKSHNFDNFYLKTAEWIKNIYIIKNWLKVKSAFGGISIYNMKEILDIYKKNNQTLYNIKGLPKDTAEHLAINLELKKNILINPNMKYTNNVPLSNNMTPYTTFVPRDAGFFSVFNFFIGSLHSGMKTYPFLNKEALLKTNNNINQHFCYWTDQDNCWFDYFEPIKFNENDENHTSDIYKSFSMHKGESSPKEFRIPKDTHLLMKNQNFFNMWRKNVNSTYTKYIKFNQEIIDSVNYFWDTNFIKDLPIIGIHYRHPSHFIESGKIFLEQYFEKIDNILTFNPDSQMFLATDTNFGIYAFKEKYGDKIKYISDIDRLTMSEFLEWCFSLASGKADNVGFINGKGYELHHKRVNLKNNKKMTIDLISEVLCLSKCRYLINTTSNVSLAISYINPNIEMIQLTNDKS
jgi:hypothetical protein